jgi:hypothetical protein
MPATRRHATFEKRSFFSRETGDTLILWHHVSFHGIRYCSQHAVVPFILTRWHSAHDALYRSLYNNQIDIYNNQMTPLGLDAGSYSIREIQMTFSTHDAVQNVILFIEMRRQSQPSCHRVVPPIGHDRLHTLSDYWTMICLNTCMRMWWPTHPTGQLHNFTANSTPLLCHFMYPLDCFETGSTGIHPYAPDVWFIIPPLQ